MEEYREKLFASLANWVDRGYAFVRTKTNRSLEEDAYLRSYENMLMLEGLGTISMLFASYYMFKSYRFLNIRQAPSKLTAAKGATFFAVGMASTLSAYMIERSEKVLEKTELYAK